MLKTLAMGTTSVLMLAATAVLVTVSLQADVNLPSALSHGFIVVVLGLTALGLVALGVRRAVRTGVCFLLLAFAALSLGSLPALAQDVATSEGSKLTVSYGSLVMQYGLEVAGWAVTLLAGVVATAVGSYVPMAKSVVTQQRLEQAGKALLQYAINAVPNSVQNGKVTVDLGSEVVATAVARGMDVLPAKVIKAAKGGGGLAAIVFRMMNLEEGASKETVLDPAVLQLRAAGHIK